MKQTLNEEIGMSQQGIDYVNSLEVKIHEPPRQKPRIIKENEVPKIPAFKIDYDTATKALYNNIPEEIEKQRIRKQARNAWICIFVIIAITVILNWKS